MGGLEPRDHPHYLPQTSKIFSFSSEVSLEKEDERRRWTSYGHARPLRRSIMDRMHSTGPSPSPEHRIAAGDGFPRLSGSVAAPAGSWRVTSSMAEGNLLAHGPGGGFRSWRGTPGRRPRWRGTRRCPHHVGASRLGPRGAEGDRDERSIDGTSREI